MKYFLIAGEASGDLHGANLIRELKKFDPESEVICWGGDKMEEAGAELLLHYKKLAIMGFWEVLMNLRRITAYIKKCKQDIRDADPDLVILIDYPGFNLRIARYLNSVNKKVYYYISPKVWAWKKGRIKAIKKYIERMYVIFPFEPEFFKKYHYKVNYLGNPLVEAVESSMAKTVSKDKFISKYSLENKPIIALLPGSRVQEIKKILPRMAAIEKYYKDYQFIIAAVRTIDREVYAGAIKDNDIKIVYDTYNLIVNSEATLVTSGTATLETAIANIPQVVCYRTSRITYLIAKQLVKVRFISLVNLIMDKEIVKELIQDELNEKRLVWELNAILPGGWKRPIMKKNYSLLRKKLAGRGASSRIAKDIYHSLKLVGNVN